MVERYIERFIFASRWLLAPFCILLVLALFGLLLKTGMEVFHFAERFIGESESGVIVNALTVVDLTLTASLVIVVIFSVYANFVSPIDAAEHSNWPEWMASIDFTGLKLKLISSIAAISGIELLRNFMDMAEVSDRDIRWSIIIHLTFVASGLLMALTDRATHGKHDS